MINNQQTITDLKGFLKKHSSSLSDLGIHGHITEAISEAEYEMNLRAELNDYGTASGRPDHEMRAWHHGRV